MSAQPEKIKPKININLPQYSSRKPKQPAQVSKSVSVIRRELKQIIPDMNLEQRQTIADQLIEKLEARGVKQESLESNLPLTTANPQQMKADEITQVATYAYEHYPEVFEAVLTQPNLVQFLSSPILSAIVGIMAAKWLNQ
jgi:hypothetical protein